MNDYNKKGLVALLTRHFTQAGYVVQEAVNDADTLIVQTALQIANKNTVTVVADDTDILVLLVSHYQSDMADVFMLSEIARSRSAKVCLIPVRAVKEHIGQKAALQILAIHALSGCDTTSAVFGHGKGTVFRQIVQSPDSLQLTDILGCAEATHEAVFEAGKRLLIMLYGGSSSDSLNHMRYTTYMHMLATSRKRPRPERLPPTERAAYFHILRVHLHIVQWK